MKPAQYRLAALLKEHELSIAFAESMTCGYLSHCMGGIHGTSEIFKGSIVCYDESVKCSLLEIPDGVLKKYTAESQEVSDRLAKNLGRRIAADIHVAITGLAAPGGSETKEKPVGSVFISMMYKRKLYRHRQRFYGTPLQIRKKAGNVLFEFVIDVLAKNMKKIRGNK